MNRLKQMLVGLALILFGVVLGLGSVPFLASQARFPAKVNVPNDGRALAVPAKQQTNRANLPNARFAETGARFVQPKLAISASGEIAGCPIVELPQLLNSAFVQALLQLTEEQKAKLGKLNEADRLVDERQRETGLELERSKESQIDHANRALEREALLNAEQLPFARRLQLQLNQEYSFADPRVADELAITPEQKSSLQRLLATTIPRPTAHEVSAIGLLYHHALHQRAAFRLPILARDGGQIPRQVPPLGDIEGAEKIVRERNRKLAEMFPTVCQKFREVLTPEQQRQWDGMQGVRLEPWELDEIRGGLGASMVAAEP